MKQFPSTLVCYYYYILCSETKFQYLILNMYTIDTVYKLNLHF